MKGRVYQMTTTPVVNLIQTDRTLMDRYSDWLLHARGEGETSVQTAKRVLGRQDFCWTGSYRFWVWDREFTVDLGDGRQETWHWRLFASKRGMVLEIEDKFRRPYGESAHKAAVVGFEHFLQTWKTGDTP